MLREDLSAQMYNKKTMNSIGNMTNVEKELNKQDLLAYKKFDNNQYALIPGHTHVKGVLTEPSRSLVNSAKYSPADRSGKGNNLFNEDKLRKHEGRLQAYGLISVNRTPNKRHNGDATLQRSIELTSVDPLPAIKGAQQ